MFGKFFSRQRALTILDSVRNVVQLGVHWASVGRNNDDPESVDGRSGDDVRRDVSAILRVGDMVCCEYEAKPWIGLVDKVSDEFRDYLINFMHPNGPARQFHWPSKQDKCWVLRENIICVGLISAPALTSSSSRQYSFSKTDHCRIVQHSSTWPATH